MIDTFATYPDIRRDVAWRLAKNGSGARLRPTSNAKADDVGNPRGHASDTVGLRRVQLGMSLAITNVEKQGPFDPIALEKVQVVQ